MLVYLLAIASGSGSLALFLTAFFVPEIHRKGDFLWSGIGLFYALVLWVLASQINGGLLLGETAGVAVLLWAILQVLQTRWKSVPIEQRSAPSVELVNKIEKVFSEEALQKLQAQTTAIAAKFDRSKTSKTSKPEVPAPEIPVSEVISEVIPKVTVEVSSETIPETIPETTAKVPAPEPNPPESNLPEPNPPESNSPESNLPVEVQYSSPDIAPEPFSSSPEIVVSSESPAPTVESIEPSHGGENSTENSPENGPEDTSESDTSGNVSSDSEGEDS